jgi:hypothetical protein
MKRMDKLVNQHHLVAEGGGVGIAINKDLKGRRVGSDQVTMPPTLVILSAANRPSTLCWTEDHIVVCIRGTRKSALTTRALELLTADEQNTATTREQGVSYLIEQALVEQPTCILLIQMAYLVLTYFGRPVQLRIVGHTFLSAPQPVYPKPVLL